jgi:hypothetical protein
MPVSANYQQIRVMARTGDGRGPFLAQGNVGAAYSSPNVYGSMKRRKKQQSTNTQRKVLAGSNNLPPRAANVKISYKN